MTGSDRWIVIPRWDEFQHRDMARSSVPPWIKNMTRLLHDEDYLTLSLMQRGILHGLWLMYASHRRVLSESEARRELVRSAAEARRWRDTMDSLCDAGFILIVAGRPARHLASLEVEVEVDGEGGTSSVQVNPRASNELDQAGELELEHAPGNGTKGPGEIESIQSIIQRSLEEARP